MSEASGNGRNGRVTHTHMTLLVGLLGVCATVALGVGSWLLVSVVELRDRVKTIEVTRPLYEQRLIAIESDMRRLNAFALPHLERPPGWRDGPGGGAN